MSLLKRLFGSHSKSITQSQAMTMFYGLQMRRGADYGCFLADRKVQYLWISENVYKQQEPQHKLMMGLKMYLAMGKELGQHDDFPLEAWVAYDRAAEWGILEFLHLPKPMEGYLININPKQFEKRLEQEGG